MPSAKSHRASIRKAAGNAPLRTRAKTFVKRARILIEASDFDNAEKAVRDAVVALDKASQKGAIHTNNADRRKSRIMLMLNKARKA
ncbi:MAG: 30S ribosomal protein S20 [SAR202 cluster bacterium]|nr:30S ribosomal protein S20 [SAR202 cluster bacterium]PCH91078.1 MAG: 30S ribosomal protein S20 [Dehalococcoidia bacterium]RUA05838.1 MAG: 30S ribosomal protein S20 [Candidatus Poseidoniales archaeon]